MSGAYGFISSTMADASAWASNLQLPRARKGGKQADGPAPEYIILAAAVCVIFPFDLYQLVFMSVGAFCYWAVQSGPQFSKNKTKKSSSPASTPSSSPSSSPKPAPWRRPVRNAAPAAFQVGGGQERSLHKQLAKSAPGDGYGREEKVVKTVTMRPIETPVFQSSGFDSEVAELVSKIKASPESIRAVEQLASRVRRAIRQVLPEADVVGFSSGDFRQTKAFGVAVPEVDVVITVNPDDLARRCQGRLSAATIDFAKVHKSAIRLCAERLVSNGGFKFRRSAFRGSEPKVTLLAVHETEEPIPLDLSVNSSTPMHNMALLAECERIDPRAKELILLVRRWAKDRGVCHAAKGHLSPYLWSLLAIYFLQLDECSEGPILPSLDFFELPEGLRSRKNGAKWTPPARAGGEPMTVAALFKEFVNFYGGVFDWSNEAISIRQGARAPGHVKLPRHRISQEGAASSIVGPTIEDPFDAVRNLGTCMNATSFTRLQEEFARAKKLCCSGASLTGLLELWSPPDNEPAECAESSSM